MSNITIHNSDKTNTKNVSSTSNSAAFIWTQSNNIQPNFVFSLYYFNWQQSKAQLKHEKESPADVYAAGG